VPIITHALLSYIAAELRFDDLEATEALRR
jgi:hypothetical protein